MESIRREAERLKGEGVNVLIALGHSGFEVDKEIAAKVPLIDLVVGGHSNTFLYNGDPPSVETPEGPYPFMVEQEASGKMVPVVQAFAYTKYLGVLRLQFNDVGDVTGLSGNPILLDNSISQDERILRELEPWKDKIEELGKQIKGDFPLKEIVFNCFQLPKTLL